MKFWDSSAVVPLILGESMTAAMQTLVQNDPGMLVWWATEVECASAIARLTRDGALEGGPVEEAFERLKQLSGSWHEVEATDAVREVAVRFLRVHPLRAGDALQLAAAFIAAERRPSSLEIVTLDGRLAEAARKEGFVVDAYADE